MEIIAMMRPKKELIDCKTYPANAVITSRHKVVFISHFNNVYRATMTWVLFALLLCSSINLEELSLFKLN